MRSCLICDDHLLMRDALAMTVQARWHAVDITFASSFGEARETAAQMPPDLCMVDLAMPGLGGAGGRSRVPDGVTGL